MDLPRKKKGEFVSAAHINKLSEAAGIVFRQGRSSRDNPMNLRIVIVTRVIDEENLESSGSNSSMSSSSDSVTSASSNSGDDADDELACAGANYEVVPRYFDHETLTWETADDEGPFCLDASEFGDGLDVGDKVLAWWDTQRDMYVGWLGFADGVLEEGESSAKWGKILADAEPWQNVSCRVYTGLPGPGLETSTSEIVIGHMPGIFLPSNSRVRLAVTRGFTPNIYDIMPYECPDEEEAGTSSSSSSSTSGV